MSLCEECRPKWQAWLDNPPNDQLLDSRTLPQDRLNARRRLLEQQRAVMEGICQRKHGDGSDD